MITAVVVNFFTERQLIYKRNLKVMIEDCQHFLLNYPFAFYPRLRKSFLLN